MSLVVFPFKYENTEVLLGNIRYAAEQDRIDEVLGIGFEEEKTYQAFAAEAPAIEHATGTKVRVMLQERIGDKRPGKGDAMNTGLLYFLESGHNRLHFYDADITSFSDGWIRRAEEAADRGYDVVRHYFPRASTDGMITWLITRVGFSILWPDSELPWIEQPLGGELLLTREAAAVLAGEPRVRAQSDWGIDTLYTFFSVHERLSLFEVYIHEGKFHKLYGGLDDLQTMLVECFAALQSLQHETVTGLDQHRTEHPGGVPEEIFHKIGYDIEKTLGLLKESWTPRQTELLLLFPTEVREGLLAARTYPRFAFMDELNWYDSYRVLLANFELGDPDWEALLFKLWLARVLEYTAGAALRGYGYSTRYLHDMVIHYMDRAMTERATA